MNIGADRKQKRRIVTHLLKTFELRRNLITGSHALLSTVFSMFLLHGSALGEVMHYQVRLEKMDGQGPEHGVAELEVHTDTEKAEIKIQYSGLNTSPTKAALLAPASYRNSNRTLVSIPLPPDAKSPFDVTLELTPAAVSEMQYGDWLLLLGTDTAPELAGAVKLEK